MAIDKEIWSTIAEANLFEKTPLIRVANRDFEGDLQRGKTVNVYNYPLTGLGSSDYDGDTPVDFTRLKPSVKQLIVDQAKSFGFRVDNIDLIQNSPDSIQKFLEGELYTHSKEIDGFLLNLCKTKIVNKIDFSAVKLSKENIVSILEEINIALDEKGASDNRFVYVDSRTLSILRQANLINVTKAEDGVVGPKEVFYFGDKIEIISSSLIKPESNGTLEIIAGTKDMINFVSQIENIKDTELTAVGLDATGILGVYTYGAEIFNIDKGVKLIVKDYKAI